MSLVKMMKNLSFPLKASLLVVGLLVAVYLSLVVSFWPKDYFWVERDNAVMPVWVEGMRKVTREDQRVANCGTYPQQPQASSLSACYCAARS